MTLLITLMCADRKLHQLEAEVQRLEDEHVAQAARELEREMLGNGDDLLKATTAVLHRSCHVSADTLQCGQCKVTAEFEKRVLELWAKNKLARTSETTETKDNEAAFDYGAAWDDLRTVKREIQAALGDRNRAAYSLVQKFFARAHLKRCTLGLAELDPVERLLCDYQSVRDLKLSKDTKRLFGHVAAWLRTRKPEHCRGCGKKCPPPNKGGIRCGACKMLCYCSIKCEVSDGANQIFSHTHECGLL